MSNPRRVPLKGWQLKMPYSREQKLIWDRDRRAICRDIIDQAKDVPCTDCRQQYPPYVMQFDHVRGKKRFDLAQALSKTRNPKVVREEIAKCEVVCANCHAERTYTRAQDTKFRRNTGKRKQIGDCTRLEPERGLKTLGGSTPSASAILIVEDTDHTMVGDCCATCLNCFGGGTDTIGCICDNPRMSMCYHDIQQARKKTGLI